jgi:chromosome segregation ATPase
MSEDLTQKLPASDSDKLTLIVTEVQRLNIKTDALHERLDRVEEGLQGLNHKVELLDHKVEERLYDTRPIWEKLVSEVAQLQEGQERVEESQQRCEERFDVLEKESREIKTFMRDILRRMSIFFDTLVTLQADYRDIYDRVRGLEIKNG